MFKIAADADDVVVCIHSTTRVNADLLAQDTHSR